MARKESKKQKAAGQAAAAAPRRSWTVLWLSLSLVVIAFGVYANCLSNGFVSDDNFQLLNNPLVADWHYLPVIMRTNVWAFAGAEVTNYYRPFQMMLYMALFYLRGQSFDPFTYHLVMVLIHIINTVLLFLLGRRLLSGMAAAWVAAALFAVHPIHTEAVVWIAVLPDVLITLMILSALLLFHRDDGRPRGWWIAVHAGIYLLCLLTKETGVVLLALLGAYEWLYRRRPLRELLWNNRIFYGAMLGSFAVYAALRIRALGGFAPAQNFYYHLTPKDYFLSIVVTLGEYLGKLFWPTNLNYYHLFDATTTITGEFVAALIGVLAAFAIWMAGAPELGERLRARPSPVIAFGIFWTLVPLFPVMNLTGVGENVFTERYLYLPSAGFLLAAAAAWQWIASRQKQAAWGFCALCLAAGGYATVVRNPDWSDDIKLFTISAKQSPRSGTLIGNLGWFYYQRGMYPEAIEKYEQAIKLQPDTALFYNNLGNAQSQMGQRDAAINNIQKALALKPGYWEAWMNLGLAYEGKGDIPSAIAAHQHALQLKPNYAEALTALALIYMKTEKNYPMAIELLQKAVESRPLYTEAHINLGVAYNDTQQWAKGAEAFQNAIRVGTKYPSIYIAHFNLGIAYSNLNASQAAFSEFRTAWQMHPEFTQAKDAAEKMAEKLKTEGGGSLLPKSK